MNKTTDDLDHEIIGYDIDPAYQRHSGICRACKKFKHHVSNDDGYCGDCN